ncbi:Pentatricopeptide repeat-containing protein -mitochondrial [Striga hermonthica]|uniref:Pentatricopeptide repeat-containing protein -mitochondrial n=1 Tax=Striga hermonthica TaxID=68872 RepID=A0A9N7R1X6_STRHE|nr:Pentatricopeptide repeat-containing protein -mitochondrial [Striga hermonthica]
MKNLRQLRSLSTFLHTTKNLNEFSASTNHSKNPIFLPHRTIPPPTGQDSDFITIAHSYIIHSEWDKLDKLASALSPFRIKHILLKTRKDYVLSLEFFNWVGLKSPDLNTLEVTSIILHILTRNRKFKSSESILKGLLEMRSSDLNFPRRVFEALIHSYRMCESSPRVFDLLFKTHAHMKKFRNASDCFRWMKEYGFFPTIESCNAYLSSLSSLNRADIVLAFYKEICRCRITPNVYTVNMVMGAYGKLGKLDMAIELFKEMESMGLACNVVSYNTLIAGYCAKGLVASGMKIKNAMDKNGAPANDVTYNTLIHGLCMEGRVHEASKLLREMKSVGVNPTTVTYNVLIGGYGENGNSGMALQLFDEMSVSGVKADILTYNAVIMGLCKEGKTRKAAYMVRELDREKLVPNSSTFAALIAGQCTRSNGDRAFEIYKSMVRSGCHPNGSTFEMLISTFLKNEDYEGAVRILREMMERAIAPDFDKLSSLFDGLCQCGKEDLVMDLRNEMESRQIMPGGFL